jgi:hypothetical protein
MVVAPLPVVALLILIEAVVLAIILVPAIPIRVIHNDFVIVPAVIVVVIVVVIADRSPAANAHCGNQSNGREGQQRGAALEHTHTVNPPFSLPEAR